MGQIKQGIKRSPMNNTLAQLHVSTNSPVDGSGGGRRTPVDGSGGGRRTPVDGSGGGRRTPVDGSGGGR